MEKNMAFEQWDRHMVCDGKIQNLMAGESAYGYEFYLQYPTYRGTFLSCIEGLEVEVDGVSVNGADILFSVNGKEFLLSELPGLFREYWFILDHASLRVLKGGGLPSGSSHKIRVVMKHRIPYTGYFGAYLTPVSECIKTLTVG
jgi:hypothetical protein